VHHIVETVFVVNARSVIFTSALGCWDDGSTRHFEFGLDFGDGAVFTSEICTRGARGFPGFVIENPGCFSVTATSSANEDDSRPGLGCVFWKIAKAPLGFFGVHVGIFDHVYFLLNKPWGCGVFGTDRRVVGATLDDASRGATFGADGNHFPGVLGLIRGVAMFFKGEFFADVVG
jgi:hypothetical protein